MRQGISCEPLFTATPYEKVLDMLSRGGWVREIQYELSDLSVLGKMHEFVIDQRNELFLLLHTSAWMKIKVVQKNIKMFLIGMTGFMSQELK